MPFSSQLIVYLIENPINVCHFVLRRVNLLIDFAAFFKDKIGKLRSELPEVDVPHFFAALNTPTLHCSLEYFSPTTVHEL